MTALLAINAGSSSLKFALFADDDGLALLARGEVSGLKRGPRLRAYRSDVDAPTDLALVDVVTPADALAAALQWIDGYFPQIYFAAIGHRVVHGGSEFRSALVVDNERTLRALEALDPLAPQHQPYNIAALRTLRLRFPRALQVACFDTAFHGDWDDRARRIALPRRFHDAGVRRYGFHGLSYEYLSERLRVIAPGARRAVLAHLGSGASICAVLDGKSIDSSMGFSVLDGVPMATRCGEIDPGVIFHLHRKYGLSFDEIEGLLYYDSGLKGASGLSADMRDLLASPATEARQAVDLFVYRCVCTIGAMAAALNGIDALVFSGGIGQHAPQIRAQICQGLGFLGTTLDVHANAAGEELISESGCKVGVFAIATDEERVIAQHCRACLTQHALDSRQQPVPVSTPG